MDLQRVFLIPGLFCLASCSVFSPKAEFIPDNEALKEATVGIPYLIKINIVGGGVSTGHREDSTPGFVKPDDMGISLRNCQLPEWRVRDMDPQDPNDYNCVEVYGTPTKAGMIKITLRGGMYGNMFIPAGYFSKDYTLTVVAPEK